MNSKEYLIEEIQRHVLNFNEFWEDPITESELIKNTLDTAESIKSYCEMLLAYHKKNKKIIGDYTKYPVFIQETISEIISLVNDGRDLWHKVTYNNHKVLFSNDEKGPREYDHHVEKNGHIDFENNPFHWIDGSLGIIKHCEDLITILSSEERLSKDVDFSEITKSNLYYDFEGYESGSMSVKFKRIYIKGEDVLIDGRIVYYTTYDSHTVDFPGIVIMDVEDYDICHLPYVDEEDLCDEETEEVDGKVIFDMIKSHKALTESEVVNQAKKAIESYITDRY